MTPEAGRLAPVLENLGESTVALGREHEKRLGHLSELAEEVVRALAPTDMRTLLAALPQALEEALPTYLAGEDTPTAHAATLRGALASLAGYDAAELTLLLRRAAERRLGAPLTLSDLAEGTKPPPARSRVVYVSNPLSDAAVPALTASLGAPRVAQRQTLRELFDDVDNGYADYAILPMSSDGVPIPSVTTLLDTYEMKLAAIHTVPTEEGGVVFGLLCRLAVELFPPRYLLLRLLPEREGELAAILAAAGRLSCRIPYLAPTPLTYDRGRFAYRLVAAGDADGLASLALYLALFAKGHTVCGCYDAV